VNCSISEHKSKQVIRLYPEIILHALYKSEVKNGGNGARLYFMARSADYSGHGSLVEKQFKKYCINQLGLSDWIYRRWLQAAIELELMTILITKRGIKRIILTGYSKVAGALGISKLQPMKDITYGELLGKGWKSELLALALIDYQVNPISRAAIENILGVKKQTQRRLEKKTKRIRSRHNYAVLTDVLPGEIARYRESVNNNVFIQKINGVEKVVKRIPDSKIITGSEVRKANSTLRKINARLRSVQLNVMNAVNSKVYFDDNKSMRETKSNRRYLYLRSDKPNWFYSIPNQAINGHNRLKWAA